MTPQPMPLENLISEREQRWRGYLHGVTAGDAQALARLYDDTSPVLYSLACRILGNPADAEEIILEVFDQVWRNARLFDPARGTVWRWLTLLTRSRALDRLRSSAARRKREQPALADAQDISSDDPLPDETNIFRQQQRLIRQALGALPPEQRQALELAYFSELTHVEIAATLGVPLGTIKTRIRTGMEKLRAALTAPVAPPARPTE